MKQRVIDRRVQKTQRLLHEALGTLIQEKSYDDIAVTEILDRANVGRSTFYTHFRDKDELLVSGIHDILRAVHPTERPSSRKGPASPLWFSLPMFEHLDRHRRAGEARMGRRGRAILHEHLRRALVDLIADDVKKDLPARKKPAGQIPSDLLVHYVVSTFILVLNWWVESASPLPAQDVNEIFRRLVLPALVAAQG